MFCSQCGAEATGRFCWRCGAALHNPDSAEPSATAPADPPPPAPDWSHELRYQVLKDIPEVRERIANAAAGARKGMSAESFLELGDKLLGTSGSPLPLSSIAQLVAPVYERLGIQTGKQRSEDLGLPPGRVIVGVLCSLAARSMTVERVHQGHDGFVVEAKVPSSPRAFNTTLVATVSSRGDITRVEAAAASRGQMFDWGLSKSVLENLFADVARYAAPDIVG